MKILSLDIHFEHPEVTIESFNSNISLLGFDLIIWNPLSIFSEYTQDKAHSPRNGYLCLTEEGKNDLISDIERRHNEIKKLLEIGKTIVIILPWPKICYHSIHEGNRTYFRVINMSQILPFNEIEPVLAEGENVVFKGSDILKPFWDNVQGHLHYYAHLKNVVGRPFLYIKDTPEVVGTFFEHEKGRVIIIPDFKHISIMDDQREEKNIKFVESIKALDKAISNGTEEYNIPDWVSKYLLPGEEEKNNLLNEKIQEKKILESNILNIKENINYLNKNKILICGTGKPLENQVANIFEDIGFKIIDQPEGRDDIIVSYNDIPAVIEVKGVTKSAAEKHAAQLEKWVSNYYEINNKPCKGILVVNAFYNTPLEERPDEAFPKQMIPYTISRGHCLITTTQLLGMYLNIKSNPKDKDLFINELYNTAGIYKKFGNYNEFLKT